MDRLAKRLLNDFQRDFPLVSRPYAAIAEKIGASEDAVIAMLEALRDEGTISRVGPVFRPNRLGASTLAALSVSPERLEEVAEIINRHPGVNHNYEREHALNLWFVVTAPDAERRDEILRELEAETGCKVLSLPLLEEFHIDLGFGLWR
jgi:DNA-binding Lrp family transcriptional regulator